MFVTQHPAGHVVGGKEEPVEQPKKFSRFFGGNTVKKRQRLVMITSNARVLMCAAGTNDKKLKEEVSLLSAGCAWRSFQDSKGLTAWLVETVRDPTPIPTQPPLTTPTEREAIRLRRPQEYDERPRRQQVLEPRMARQHRTSTRLRVRPNHDQLVLSRRRSERARFKPHHPDQYVGRRLRPRGRQHTRLAAWRRPPSQR